MPNLESTAGMRHDAAHAIYAGQGFAQTPLRFGRTLDGGGAR